jgi:hypothetical protein
MESREKFLQTLNETIEQLLAFYHNIPDPNINVYELWSAKDVLAHLTFWHENFARNVNDLVNGRNPKVLKGRFIDLNQSGVDTIRPETLVTVMGRFQSAHLIILKNILNPALVSIPYKRGSRDYTPEEHLDIVAAHINKHLCDVKKSVECICI